VAGEADDAGGIDGIDRVEATVGRLLFVIARSPRFAR
jgi:hypothetical protein